MRTIRGRICVSDQMTSTTHTWNLSIAEDVWKFIASKMRWDPVDDAHNGRRPGCRRGMLPP